MNVTTRKIFLKLSFACCLVLSTTACVGTVVGAVVDTAVEVVKIPFKVGGALIDVVTPDELAEQEGKEQRKLDEDEGAIKLEQEGI